MRIAINGLFLNDQKTGGGRYLSDLIENLQPLGLNDQYFAILNKTFYSKNFIKNPLVKITHGGNLSKFRPTRIIWENLILPKVIDKNAIDLLHAAGFTLPPKIRCKTIITIFDMTFFTMPEVHQKRKIAYFTSIMPSTLKKANMIIAISEQTKKDIIKVLNIPEKKIKTIYLGLNKNFKHIDDLKLINNIKKKYGLKDRYILFVGTIEPRKNISNLVRAYYALKKKGMEHQLVIVGKLGWNYKEIFNLISRFNITNDIKFTNYILDEDMPFIYNGADAFVYPSLYEGFGIPILEAMACGTPVITSNVSSMPEVTKDAAILVDPNSVEEICSSIKNVLSNTELATLMKEKGIKRASFFDNKKMAAQTTELYKNILDN